LSNEIDKVALDSKKEIWDTKQLVAQEINRLSEDSKKEINRLYDEIKKEMNGTLNQFLNKIQMEQQHFQVRMDVIQTDMTNKYNSHKKDFEEIYDKMKLAITQAKKERYILIIAILLAIVLSNIDKIKLLMKYILPTLFPEETDVQSKKSYTNEIEKIDSQIVENIKQMEKTWYYGPSRGILLSEISALQDLRKQLYLLDVTRTK